MTEEAPAAPAATATPAAETPPSAPATPAIATESLAGSLLTDTNPEATPGAESAPATAESPAATDAAVEYTDFKLPEGMKLADESFADFKALAKDAGLSQEKAQTLLEKGLQLLQKGQQDATTYYNEINTKWRAEVEKDAEIGGKNFDATKAVFSKGLAAVANQAESAEFRQALALTGAGNNPIVIKVLARMAKSLTEGSHITGNPASKPKSMAEIMYPKKSE